MRIAYICADPGVPVFGTKGCSIHVQEMVRTMLDAGHEIDLFTARSGGNRPADLRDCVVHELPLQATEDVRSREIEQVLWNDRLVHALSKHPRFDLLYERHSLWSAYAMRWARQHRIPSVLEVNAPLIDEQIEHRKLVQRHLARTFARGAMSNATVTYTVSKQILPYCKRFLKRGQRAQVIPNGVNTQRFAPSVPAIDPYDGFTVGFVGSLKPWHGVAGLVDAFALLVKSFDAHSARQHVHAVLGRPPRLLIVGDGPMRETIAQQVKQMPQIASLVKFVGAVTPSEIPGWINSMDVAVAPYPALDEFYFSPLKIYEYMASGRAVVASATGQIRDIIKHRGNGLLYRPGDTGELAAALRVMHDDVNLRQRIGENARRFAMKHSWQDVLAKVLTMVDRQRLFESMPRFSAESVHVAR